MTRVLNAELRRKLQTSSNRGAGKYSMTGRIKVGGYKGKPITLPRIKILETTADDGITNSGFPPERSIKTIGG